ncbi:WD40/YVTN/BNR-like repeat-containing protein [Tahibacter amnicola]|uniref:Sortilin N-terminal domain-containing protein n=1 Tax=Tahibacter amnicola TaxID=2976241 RepID=A0ABY6BJ07_9GAMM|nr:sialidase family protein [Tahibacter amnicola]UXI69080.1 hypothetical protein N4264_05360 [Tahibacter amnicola]
MRHALLTLALLAAQTGFWPSTAAAEEPETGFGEVAADEYETGEYGEHPAFGRIDREEGEAEQIEQRQRWFIQTRGLERQPDAGERRAAAMASQRTALRAGVPPLISAGERWESVGPNAMSMLSWTMGLVAGRTTSLSVRPGNDNVLYLGTAAGGLWKSTNAGATWTRLSDVLDSPSIGAVLANAGAGSAPDDVWVGTGEAYAGGCGGYFGQGIYHSTDGGATFTPRNGSGSTALNLSFINAIARHPANTQTLLVGGSGKCTGGSSSGSGVYRTTDGGATWTRVISTGNSMDIVFHPGNGNIAYAAVNGSGVHKSTDGGVTWTVLAGGMPASASNVRLAMAPSDSNTLYALAGSPVGLYKTTDAGATWTKVNAAACEGQCSYNLAVDVHPTDPNRVLVGTIRPALSTDGGVTLTTLTTTWGSAQKVHQDIHIVRFSRSNGSRLWIGSDGGLWRSEDQGVNYTNLNAGLHITQFYDIALDVRSPDRIYGGSQDNSSEVRNGSNVWAVTMVSGDGFMNASEPGAGADNGKNVYQTSYPQANKPAISRSSNFGAPSSFGGLAKTGISDGEPFPWVTPLVVTKGTLFAGSNFVYRAATSQTNSAFTWTKMSPNLSGDGSNSISVLSQPAAAGTSPLRLYAGTSNGKLWRTTDALAASPTWTDITAGYPGGRPSDIALTPGNDDVIYVTRSAFGGSKLYKSTNGGSTWSAAGTGLPDVPANSVVVDTVNTQRVFVGTDIGVYESTDGGASFRPLMLGLPPGTVVVDLEISASPHVLVAGTYGSGAWKLTFGADNDTIFANGFNP